MFASIFAAERGHEVHVYEKNEKLGKKLFITGKGRCNLTNACDMDTLFASIRSNPKFLYSAFYGFDNRAVMEFFEENGLPLKTERGERVFPVSDHSSDVIRTLEKKMNACEVKIHLRSEVEDIIIEETQVKGIRLKDGARISGDAVIVATGGVSYQTTGSTGDGYRFARICSHRVIEAEPSLVPMVTAEPFVRELQGLSLKNVEVTFSQGKREVYREFGEMLFTHFGVSGPLILTASSYVGSLLKKGPLKLCIDLKPALTGEQLDQRLLRDFQENRNRQFKNALGKLFPAKLIPVMIALSGIDPEKQVNEVSREERRQFGYLIKHLPMTVTGLRDFKEAIITRGGVSVKEIDPATMESKLVKGLSFIGEVLDLDAVTGGFNLQIAWSTAYAAGTHVCEEAG